MLPFQGRDTKRESELVELAVKLVQHVPGRQYNSIRHHQKRCRIAIAVRNGVDDLPTLVAV
jgi:hypothetical protein